MSIKELERIVKSTITCRETIGCYRTQDNTNKMIAQCAKAIHDAGYRKSQKPKGEPK